MQFGDYNIVRTLSAGKSFLATDSSGRQVVLKMLSADCLIEDHLNPSIAARLARVRDVAVTGVASLRSVERDGGHVFMVWEYIDGETFDAYATYSARSGSDMIRLARDLLYAIERFHATGLVHGALHGRNVMVDSTGRVYLTDVSPLLFLDRARDEAAFIAMLKKVLTTRGEAQEPFGLAVANALEGSTPLKDLSSWFAADSPGERIAVPSIPTTRVGRLSVVAAIGLLLFGIGVVAAVSIGFRHARVPSALPATTSPP